MTRRRLRPVSSSYYCCSAICKLKAIPEIDAKHIFLGGFSLGGYSSLLATDSKNPASHDRARVMCPPSPPSVRTPLAPLLVDLGSVRQACPNSVSPAQHGDIE